jgi:hypothetical protein
LPITAAAEKDGQSVDFTAHHGANLCNSGLDPSVVRVSFILTRFVEDLRNVDTG